MAVANRLETLRQRHASKENELHTEEIRPYPNEGRVATLKRDKLSLKDEIERLSQQTGGESRAS